MWTEIRRRVLVEGVSKRQIQRETGLHFNTLEKILTFSEPPGYRLKGSRPQPKLGPYLDRIRQIIRDDKHFPRKQRHTAKRIYDCLRAEGYTGGETQVKKAVREIKRKNQEVFMPLIHRPGEAQVDFGYALVKENNILRRVVFFVMSLPFSDAIFVQVFERICTEVFQEAHRRAFEFFGGVPWRISYDNERVFVVICPKAKERRRTYGFLQLQSHYLFEEHFCRVCRPNEKGTVESMIRYVRSNYMVPVPVVRDLEELNIILLERCREELKRKVRGKSAGKKILFGEDQTAFLPLPATEFDACRKISTTSSSLSLVRFDCNDYSVPVRFAHHSVVVKGYIDRVVICHKDELIATHKRLWCKERVSFDPLHYLALLERKPGALDHARPLEGWQLPNCFGILRRRLEDERAGEGTREYIRVLRLLEKHSISSLSRAVEKGLRVNALSRDAIAQFLIPQEQWCATTFRLDGRDHLRQVNVQQTDIAAYSELLVSGGI
ncbi:IS21 family transposase [Gemmatimonadota bacterium]